MTADVELLPLPPLGECSEDSVQEWGRANVAHATAAKDAEIEALRAEVALLRVGAENERLHQRGLLDRERERAERLAEALRDAADDIDAGIAPETAAAHLRARADLLVQEESPERPG